MYLIIHRGNINGPNQEEENNSEYFGSNFKKF